jgi:hypothetical protein
MGGWVGGVGGSRCGRAGQVGGWGVRSARGRQLGGGGGERGAGQGQWARQVGRAGVGGIKEESSLGVYVWECVEGGQDRVGRRGRLAGRVVGTRREPGVRRLKFNY